MSRVDDTPLKAAVLSGVLIAIPVVAMFCVPFWLRGPKHPAIEVRDGVNYFHGARCTQDCSGHLAGYLWAREHGIEDPYKCGGNSASFKEGCQIYAREQIELDAH